MLGPLRPYVFLILPLFLIQVGLQVWALVDLARRPRVRGAGKVSWVILILLAGILGPVLYFVLGGEERVEKEEEVR